tara:strand:+ start:2454 stop:4034 length:1581 start_codon:yes stop_codon:yes gene_type:complete
MKVIISMSGLSSRFSNAGYTIPKFMIDIDGKKVIEHIIDLYPKDSDFLFIINDKHAEDTDIIELLENSVDKKNIVVIPRHKRGPVFSIQNFEDYINDDEQVVINYCDFSMYWDYDDFEKYVNETKCDGCVVCYTGFHPHMLGSDNYAFCRTDSHKELQIREIREKQPFTNDKMSEFASTGTYYFKKGSYVKKYFKKLIEKDININCEYYVSLVHNLLIEDGLVNLVYEIPHMLQWGTPSDVAEYMQWSNYNRNILKGQKKVDISNCVTVIPMAGQGSRFLKEGYDIPKPFIPINGFPMFEQALRCLPNTSKTIFGSLKSHKDLFVLEDYGKVVWLDDVLPGQACTTERIINEILDPDTSILVSACDNGVLYEGDKFIDLINDIDNDIIVWTYRNNYTSYYNPNAYSWVDVDDENIIRKVYVKNFKGDNPLNKGALVGTIFFRNKNIYNASLTRLYEKNIRINGEYSLDDLLNEAIELGYIIRNFEVDRFICWGTPNDLKTYEYWQRFFSKVDWHPYEYSKDYFTLT